MNRRRPSEALVLCALLFLFAVNCGDEGPTGTTEPPTVVSVEVTPATQTLTALGETVQFTAVAKDADGRTIAGRTFTWTSSATGVATVTAAGLATALDNGTTTVRGTTAGVSGSASLTVSQAVATLEVTPPLATLTPGETRQLTAVAQDANGNAVAGASFDWSSSDQSVATVDAGLATAAGSGEATIRAEAGGVSDDATVTVVSFASVTAWHHHTCGLTTDGDTYCWGLNELGQLGDGTTTNRTTPVPVSGGLVFASVDASYSHTCGVTSAGSAYCWGANWSGQLGDGTTTERHTPVAVSGGLSFASVTSGGSTTCGLTSGGSAYCWGANDWGQLGIGSSDEDAHPSPEAVSGGLSFATVIAGGTSTCGVTGAGSAYCWGRNNWGQLGDGTTTDRLAPVAVSGGLVFAVVAPGPHTCGVTTGGNVYCWGWNEWGQLGDGTTSNRTTPVPVSGGLSFASVIAGNRHTCGATTGGSAYCWGANDNGQLGDGELYDFITIPVAVSGGLSFASLTAGGGHTCGLTTAGSVYCWGWNLWGQLGDGTTIEYRTTPVRLVWGH